MHVKVQLYGKKKTGQKLAVATSGGQVSTFVNIPAGGGYHNIGLFQKAFHTSLVLALLLGAKADFWLVFGKYIYLVFTPI